MTAIVAEGYPTAESRARDTTTRSPIQAFRIQTKPLNQCTKTILHSRDSASIFLMSIFSGLCVIIHYKNTKSPRPTQLRTMGQRIFPVGGREYQEYSVIFAQ